MWKCKGCSEQIEAEFERCWKCSTWRDGRPASADDAKDMEEFLPTGERFSDLAASNSQSRSKKAIAEALTRRYTDAYIAARWLIGIGGIVKFVAVVVSILFVVFGFVIANALGTAGLIVGALGLAIGIPIFVLGIQIAGQGQTHLATLDTAVNTSRHLSNDDVAAIILG